MSMVREIFNSEPGKSGSVLEVVREAPDRGGVFFVPAVQKEDPPREGWGQLS